jgi:hypothetical protein
MKKAKTVSEWIMQKLNEGYYQYYIAYILNCSQSSVHNLIKMTHPNGELTQRAYDIIQHYDSSPQIENKANNPEQPKTTFIPSPITIGDDNFDKLMEYGHRIAKLESLVYYPEQPQVGIIRRFWRWLW